MKATDKKRHSISDILSSISSQEAKRVENRMLIAAKIDDAMKAKGWKNKDLMHAMGKSNPSEVTRWLSGTHNFTIDTLTDLGIALDVDLLNLQDDEQVAKGESFQATSIIYVVTPSQSYYDQLISSKSVHYSAHYSSN
ncbi:MAG: helix-turn-helix transcriptional regulator [Bacteroidota bacterium]|jgi:transcriptional regulator with XRE-family HTH domain|nr:helix-turn-helix transcriptional regulator [Bacteroidota bacterium]HHU97085.1 helix-turn-helix transcriptional regulator [Petrimonas sp.]